MYKIRQLQALLRQIYARGMRALHSECILRVRAGWLASLSQCPGHLVESVGRDLHVLYDMPHTLQVHMSPLCMLAQTAMQSSGPTLELVLRS